MIKLVASDLDGTLLLHKAQSLPEEIFSAVRGTGDYVCSSQWKAVSEYDKAVCTCCFRDFLYFGEWCTGSGSWRGTVSGFF